MIVDINGDILYVSAGYFYSYTGGEILQGDTVTFCGYCSNPTTYNNVQGVKNTVSSVYAEYIQIDK
ncbi:MAG TPA: hypothetical protein VIK72_14400 [Clostridiaceae bacterium]